MGDPVRLLTMTLALHDLACGIASDDVVQKSGNRRGILEYLRYIH